MSFWKKAKKELSRAGSEGYSAAKQAWLKRYGGGVYREERIKDLQLKARELELEADVRERLARAKKKIQDSRGNSLGFGVGNGSSVGNMWNMK